MRVRHERLQAALHEQWWVRRYEPRHPFGLFATSQLAGARIIPPVPLFAQVGVGAGHHADHHVVVPGDRVHLDHLGDLAQRLPHGNVAHPLADLDGDDRHHGVAEPGRVQGGCHVLDDTRSLELVEAGLHSGAGHPERARRREHPDPGILAEQLHDPDVELVDLHIRSPCLSTA